MSGAGSGAGTLITLGLPSSRTVDRVVPVARDCAALGVAVVRLDLPAGAAPAAVAELVAAVREAADLVVAITGAPAPADIDGTAAGHATRLQLAQGQTLRLRTPRTGLRTYLAVAGGIEVPAVLGSRSSDTLSGLGPNPLAKTDDPYYLELKHFLECLDTGKPLLVSPQDGLMALKLSLAVIESTKTGQPVEMATFTENKEVTA